MAVIAIVAAFALPAQSLAVNVKAGVWSGNGVSKSGEWTSLSFRVRSHQLSAFKTPWTTTVHCYSVVNPGFIYPPLKIKVTVPKLNKSATKFWGRHVMRLAGDSWLVVVTGKWKNRSTALGTFTVNNNGVPMCTATYRFSAHWRHS